MSIRAEVMGGCAFVGWRGGWRERFYELLYVKIVGGEGGGGEEGTAEHKPGPRSRYWSRSRSRSQNNRVPGTRVPESYSLLWREEGGCKTTLFLL